MLDYALARQQLLTEIYKNQARCFANTYRRKRPTIVLLPGGMGSQLERSSKPHSGNAPNVSDFDPVWLDWGILFDGDGLELEIDRQERDKDGHFVVPNGPLRFLIKAYDRTAAWAEEHGFNYVVFGYDWRRPLGDAAEWLKRFLDFVKVAVQTQRGEDPLPQTTLLAHSQGGMVAQYFLNRYPLPQWAERLITVATPFYGTWNHGDRYYVGQSPLDVIHTKTVVAKIASTLPGPYTLMPLAKGIFDRDWRKLGFQSKNDYPVVDATTKGPVDPYDPANTGRFPSWISADFISLAAQEMEIVAKPVADEEVARRITNIGAVGDKATPVRVKWRRLPKNFDPNRHGTSFTGEAGALGGDGTVPGWSAFHASTPHENRIRFDSEDVIDHTYLMENDTVLDTVGRLVDPNYAGVAVTAPTPRSMVGPRASSADVRTLADDIRSGRAGRDDPRLDDEKMWRGIVKELAR